MVSLIDMNYQTRFCKFSIDSSSDLKLLPTRESPGKDSLSTIKSCSQGSRAYATNGKTYVLSGGSEWVLYSGNSSGGTSGGDCNCDSEEIVREVLSKTKPLTFNSVQEAESKLNSGEITDIYYGQSVIINTNGKYLSYTVQKGSDGYVIEPASECIWSDKLQNEFEQWKQENNIPNATEEQFIEYLGSSNNLEWDTF